MDRRREERSTAMYLLTLELGDASTWEEIERAVVSNVERSFKADAALLLPDSQGKLQGNLPERELAAAVWAYEHVQPAGRFTDTLPMTEAMYLPLHTKGSPSGVLRLLWRQSSPPTIEQRTMLDGFQRHISLVVDRQRLREAKAQSHLLAESERLSQSLLNAVSHELRTPIAAIETAASGWQAGPIPRCTELAHGRNPAGFAPLGTAGGESPRHGAAGIRPRQTSRGLVRPERHHQCSPEAGRRGSGASGGSGSHSTGVSSDQGGFAVDRAGFG